MKKLLLTVVLGLCTLAGFSQAKFDVHVRGTERSV